MFFVSINTVAPIHDCTTIVHHEIKISLWRTLPGLQLKATTQNFHFHALALKRQENIVFKLIFHFKGDHLRKNLCTVAKPESISLAFLLKKNPGDGIMLEINDYMTCVLSQLSSESKPSLKSCMFAVALLLVLLLFLLHQELQS